MGIDRQPILASSLSHHFLFGRKTTRKMFKFCLVVLFLYISGCESSSLKSRTGMKYRAKDATAENTYVKKFTVSSEKATRTEAKTACEGLGGKLAILTSYAEVEKAAKMIGAEESYWIGGECPACSKNDLREEKWQWLTKEKIHLDNKFWKTFGNQQMPHDNDGDAKCLTLYKKGTSPQFVNFSYSWEYKYICQKMLTITSKVLKYNTIEGKKKQNVH